MFLLQFYILDSVEGKLYWSLKVNSYPSHVITLTFLVTVHVICTAATDHSTQKHISRVVNNKYLESLWLFYNKALDICDTWSEIMTAVNILRCVNGGTALAVKGWCMSLIYVQLVAFNWIVIFLNLSFIISSSFNHCYLHCQRQVNLMCLESFNADCAPR